MQTEKYKKGDVIIKEGSRGTLAYIIETGEVEVSRSFRDIKKVLTKLGEKQVFGEMGLIEDKPRSATVTATKDSIVRVISRESFNELFLKDRKVILSIVKALFERLRSATVTIARDSANAIAKNDNEKHNIVIKDNRYAVLSGLNEISKNALDGEEVLIKKFPFKIGREGKEEQDVLADNDLCIKENNEPFYVSKNHFLIDKVEGHIVVVDRSSHSGLIINGAKLNGAYILQMNENEISIGSSFSPFEFGLSVRGEIECIVDRRDNS